MGNRIQINSIVARLTASYLGVFLVVLTALDVVAYLFVLHSAQEMLQPLLAMPEGRSALDATMHKTLVAIVLVDLPLVALVGGAAYLLAQISVRPLARARAREERFAADAAHELRTPLATIAALAQADAPEALAAIRRVALDASGLLGDLLLLVRDAPAAARLYEPVDLVPLARSATASVAHHRPEIVIDLDVAPSAYVTGDARALARLIGNLVENAARFAGSTLSLRIESSSGSIVTSVSDDGPGVPPEYRDRIFERFFKAQEDGPGSGLGLAICRRIARDHRGSVTLEGANRFVVRLPAAAE